MNNASDQDVWNPKSKTIKENGGIADSDVPNKRRPPNTECLSKKSS